MSRQMTGAKMVVQALKDQGVEVVFGYPGGAVLPIYDELFLQNDIRHILVRHEQGAVHMAEGYAAVDRQARRGAGHLGPRGDERRDRPDRRADGLDPDRRAHGAGPHLHDRHRRLQEADTVGITRPCTKMNWLVKDTAKLSETIHQAFHVATQAAPAPC